MKNPKKHDALMKWLIASFTEEFFEHYFPKRSISKYTFIDKEFISKYEALKESLKDDLFLVMEVEIDKDFHEIVIQIENMSKRDNVSPRIFEYFCYAWLLRQCPVWSIVVYTDDAVWKKDVPDTFWYGFSDKMEKQHCHFDVIKVKSEKSSELVQKHSLMCKLLSLKADDKGTDREYLVREIYKATARVEDQLDNDKKLLIEQWVNAYKQLPEKTVENIKREVKMSFTATTISEHIRNEGKIEGKVEGKVEGKIEGKIELLNSLFQKGMLTKEQFKEMLEAIKMQAGNIDINTLEENIEA